MLRRLTRFATVVAVAAACADVTVPPNAASVGSVRVIPFAAWLQPGDSLRLTALALDSEGTPLTRPVQIAWHAVPQSVAEVDGSGLVTAESPGDAEIIATIEGIEGSALVHVLSTPEVFSDFRLIAAGDDFTCGVDTHGVVACWGSDALGQLGSGGTAAGGIPVAVVNVAGVTALAAGTRHACAIDDAGRPTCWGWNSVQQVGLDVLDKIVATPRPVAVAGRFVALAAGSGHSCALRDDGIALCWGAGALGQLGGRSTPPVASMQVAMTEPLTAIVAGHAHTCALDAGGAAWCWGWNGAGQLGAETADCQPGNPCSAQPIRVETGVRFRMLAAGSEFTCGLDAGGRAHCWGANALGQLGHAGSSSRVPVPVDGVPAFVDLATGSEHACGLTEAGGAYCWGANRQGQLGDGTTDPRPGPVAVEVATAPGIRIAAGGAHTCALSAGGRVVCWGANAAGQLGPFSASR